MAVGEAWTLLAAWPAGWEQAAAGPFSVSSVFAAAAQCLDRPPAGADASSSASEHVALSPSLPPACGVSQAFAVTREAVVGDPGGGGGRTQYHAASLQALGCVWSGIRKVDGCCGRNVMASRGSDHYGRRGQQWRHSQRYRLRHTLSSRKSQSGHVKQCLNRDKSRALIQIARPEIPMASGKHPSNSCCCEAEGESTTCRNRIATRVRKNASTFVALRYKVQVKSDTVFAEAAVVDVLKRVLIPLGGSSCGPSVPPSCSCHEPENPRRRVFEVGEEGDGVV